MASAINSIMNEVIKLQIEEEVELLNLVAQDLREKMKINEERKYFQRIGETSLKKIWDNKEDDIYSELLKR